VAISHPPIPEPTSQLPRTSSYIDYSALPYSQVYVHFPPSPTLASTHVVDSPRFYDRSPIIVAENSCAMPRRGCPGRTYTTVDRVGHGVALSNNAVTLSCPKPSLSPSAPSTIPRLVRDQQGSSDDSDAISFLPENLGAACHALCPHCQHSPICRAPHTLEGAKEAESPVLYMSPQSSKSSSDATRSLSSSFTSSWDTSSCLEGF